MSMEWYTKVCKHKYCLRHIWYHALETFSVHFHLVEVQMSAKYESQILYIWDNLIFIVIKIKIKKIQRYIKLLKYSVDTL